MLKGQSIRFLLKKEWVPKQELLGRIKFEDRKWTPLVNMRPLVASEGSKEGYLIFSGPQGQLYHAGVMPAPRAPALLSLYILFFNPFSSYSKPSILL